MDACITKPNDNIYNCKWFDWWRWISVTVAARNARGQGDYATTTVAEIPQGPPGLVQNLVLVAGVGQVTLDWDPGTDGVLVSMSML